MPGSNVSQHLQLTNISGWSFKRNLLLLKLHFLIFALKQKWNITSGHRWSTKPQKHIISPVIWVTKGGKVRGTNRWISNFKVEKTPCVHELTRKCINFCPILKYRHTYMYELGLQGKVQHPFCLVRNKKVAHHHHLQRICVSKGGK